MAKQVISPPALEPLEPGESLGKRIEKAIEQASGNGDKGTPYYLSLETAMAVMEKALHDTVLESTTNLDDNEIEKLSNAMVIYYYTRNKAILVKAVTFMKMKRSLTDKPKNVLSGLFELPGRTGDTHLDVSENKFLDRFRKRWK